MATTLEECNTEEQRSVVSVLWEKGLNANYIHKELFPIYDGKCLSRKAVHNWLEKCSQERSKISVDETVVWNWLRQQSKDFHAAGFDALVIGQVYQCW
jgi:hypothetical protein